MASTTSFTYTLDQFPENVSYASTLGSVLSYETNSLYPSGPIAKFTITNRGRNYFELPGITTVITQSGQNADVRAFSNSIGGIKKISINDIGFDFPSDKTLSPSVGLPQYTQITPLMSLETIGVTSFGKGYTSCLLYTSPSPRDS